MTRDQAYTLIRQTFTQGFDKTQFRNLAINILNRIDESKASVWNSQYIKDAFKGHVQRYERLGTYTSPENEKLDVLIVHLTTEYKLERARTAIRNFVAHHLKTRDEKDAALVAFVSPTEKQWRFSYVKMEYATVKKESGKVDVETWLTPARRFSYIVGEGESCHTAQTRFLRLLQDTQKDPNLADIEEAFSVEAVTKEFFKRYAELFENIHQALKKLIKKDKTICDEFQAKNVNTVDFAKKVMGQIVFLYFLQKKGWLGVEKGNDWGSGPRDFLRRLANAEYGKYRNFFNDILEPLFYETLATDRGHEAWCNHFNCRIPFLNGGLFEPLGNYSWRKIDINLANRLFTNSEYVDEGVAGTGVLDMFDRYNFTVNEAEPLEKEVAIDPEMLGKVFENLIEENLRKGLGAYYTPREIVHYMCQESLINYLDTALNKEEELVPRSDLETLVHLGEQISHYEAVDANYPVKMPKSIQVHARLLDDKLADITICDPAVGSGAFPVGMMTEIVHSRSALTAYYNAVHERTPYYFKRHAIQNCLYGVDIDAGAIEIAKLRLWLSLVVDEEEVEQIKPLPNLDYKIVGGNSLLGVEKNLFNIDLFNKLEDLKPLYFDESEKKKKEKYRCDIDDLIHQLTNGKETFDFEIYFSEVFHKRGGFDVVIGNPPYVSYGLRGGQALRKEDKEFLKRAFKDSAEYKISLYAVFMEKGIRLCQPDGGVNSFIVPDSFVLGMYFSKIRAFMLRGGLIKYILLLPFNVFKSVVGFSVVYQYERRKKVPDSLMFTARTAPDALSVGTRTFKQYKYPQKYFLSTKRNKFRLFFDAGSMQLVEKCTMGAVQLESLVSFSSGLIGKEGQDAIISKSRSGTKWRPGIVSGSEIGRYTITPEGYYLLYDRAAIKSGFECVDYFVPKLLMRQTGDSLVCTYDDCGLLCLNNVHVGNLKNNAVPLKLIVGLLNSRLLNWFYQTIALEVGRVMPQTDIETLDSLPIKYTSNAKPVVELVDRIITAKKRDPVADTNMLEQEVNRLVYGLYDLTKEEISIVEESMPRK